MGAWYTIGILAGLGAAFGILGAALVPRFVIAAVAGAVAGAVVGYFVFGWPEAIAGAVGGVLGSLGATPVVAGALRRGGTRGGTALLVGLAALVVAALAFVPVLGYLEAAALPVLGRRLRRREPERHAGLRTLAGDWGGHGQAGHPDPDRRPDAVDARGNRRADAPLPARERRLPTSRLHVPVADAGLPRLGRDGRPRRRARHPPSRLVEPRRAAP